MMEMKRVRNIRLTKPVVIGAALLLSILLAVPVLASDTITMTIQGEGRSASVTSAALESVNYSHEDQVSPGAITLQVDDSSATGHGWNVTIMASNFSDGERVIPASNFLITGAGEPIHIEGAEVDSEGGPFVPSPGATGPLDTERKVLFAEPGSGLGRYNQDLSVALTVPGQTPAGEYTSNLTVNITAGP